MSTEIRTSISEAVNTVEGVTCHPYYTEATAPGSCHLQLDRIEYPNPFGGVAHWRVVVLLVAEDWAASDKYLEETVPLIKAAVDEHLAVTSVTKEQLNISGVGAIPCAVINGHREY